MIANASSSIAVYHILVAGNWQLKYCTGHSSWQVYWARTTPSPTFEVSIKSRKGQLGCTVCRMRWGWVKAVHKLLWNAHRASRCHPTSWLSPFLTVGWLRWQSGEQSVHNIWPGPQIVAIPFYLWALWLAAGNKVCRVECIFASEQQWSPHSILESAPVCT